MSKAGLPTITLLVISNLVTLTYENWAAFQGSVLCWSVLDFPQTGAQQTEAGTVAGSIGDQRTLALCPKAECNLEAILPGWEKREVHRADGPQLGTSAIRHGFLGELLRNCDFFAHMVLRQVRSDCASRRGVDLDSVRKKSNIAKLSQKRLGPSSNVLLSQLWETPGHYGEASSISLQSLWVEVACRHGQILVSEKERHDCREDSKLAL